jgi:hypothetical protein
VQFSLSSIFLPNVKTFQQIFLTSFKNILVIKMSNTINGQILERLDYKEIDTTPNLYQYNYNGRRVIQRYPENNVCSLNNNAIWQLSPESFQPGAFTTNPVTFRLKPNFCNLITDAHLQIVCSETGGANSVTPVVAPFLINRIEIGLDGSPVTNQTIYPEWLYAKYQFFYSEEVASALAFNAQNMTATAFAGESAIPAGTSATYLLPLTNCLITSIDPSTIRSDVIITIYPATNPVSAGTGTLQLTSMQLLLDSEQNPAVEAATRSLLRSNPFVHDYINFVPQTWTGTLTAGVQSEISISGVNQLAAAVLITVRASKSFTGSAIRTFADLGNDALINLTDQNKVSILGSGALQSRYLRGQQLLKTHGTMATVVPLYWILHSDIQEALATGRIAGFYNYNGYQYLQITPGSAFSSGTFTVDMYFLCYNSQLESEGQFRRLN